mmetsp:Transcript_93365/g.179567  ORF Transcript_93365/g.179567 Transcript_93365/m.179567 type:complete len:483 (-) Transcript_93365:107-1555(-)
MKREAEDLDGYAEGLPAAKRQRGRYAMKVLCSDSLVYALIGEVGDQERIEESTRCTFDFSNEGDYFPNSFLRVLVVSSDERACVTDGLDIVLQKTMELGEEERQTTPALPGLEMNDKEPGQYILRICLSDSMARTLIGPRGSTVKTVRTETGCKVFIENVTESPQSFVLKHQMARIIGNPRALAKGLRSINDLIQKEYRMEHSASEMYDRWVETVNFGAVGNEQDMAAEPPVWEPSPPINHDGALEEHSEFPPEADEWQEDFSSGSSAAPPSHFNEGHRQHGDDENIRSMHALSDILRSFPEGIDESLAYSIGTTIPVRFADWMQQENFESHMESVAGAKVYIDTGTADQEADEDTRSAYIAIEGPLMSIYHGHMLVMKRVREFRREEEEAEEARQREEQERRDYDQNIEAMKSQVAELSKKIEMLVGSQSQETREREPRERVLIGGTSSKSGKGGKYSRASGSGSSKGKGKSKDSRGKGKS